MRCPFCGQDNDKVLESRTLNEGSAIRRRRECIGCSGRFTSYERVEPLPVMVVKRDGRQQEFDIEKVHHGLKQALVKRPVTAEQMDELINRIEKKVYSGNQREIPSSDIGDLILEELKSLDPVAYIRFASVYKQFQSVKEFLEEIQDSPMPTAETSSKK